MAPSTKHLKPAIDHQQGVNTMKKLVTFATAISLVSSFNFVLPTAANASNGNNNNAAICQAIASTYAINVGNCIQFLNNNPNANAYCHYWQGPYGTAAFGIPYPFSTFGECVSFANPFFFGK
jgi:hypothetical protein